MQWAAGWHSLEALVLAKGYRPGHYKQLRKGKPLRPFEVSLDTQAIPPFAREITKR
jgi:hypothetical protein